MCFGQWLSSWSYRHGHFSKLLWPWTLQLCPYARLGGFDPGFARDNVCDGSFWREAEVVGFTPVTWRLNRKVLHSQGQHYAGGVRNVSWSPEFSSLQGVEEFSLWYLAISAAECHYWLQHFKWITLHRYCTAAMCIIVNTPQYLSSRPPQPKHKHSFQG